MRRIKLMIVGRPSYLPGAVLKAWDEAGIDLQGPVAAADLAAALVGTRPDGAVIDVEYDAPTLLGIMEIFDTFAVPALFASAGPHSMDGFSFSADRTAMNTIVHQLLGSRYNTIQ